MNNDFVITDKTKDAIINRMATEIRNSIKEKPIGIIEPRNNHLLHIEVEDILINTLFVKFDYDVFLDAIITNFQFGLNIQDHIKYFDTVTKERYTLTDKLLNANITQKQLYTYEIYSLRSHRVLDDFYAYPGKIQDDLLELQKSERFMFKFTQCTSMSTPYDYVSTELKDIKVAVTFGTKIFNFDIIKPKFKTVRTNKKLSSEQKRILYDELTFTDAVDKLLYARFFEVLSRYNVLKRDQVLEILKNN